ncbi:nucleotide pyrophosphohydrolase [Micromonospora sp. NPDC050417]|uniref:nucleotide pyrophosphohydrolase n=1 Tax=Micromonospora sp. NPDC050417 TaxID=3364280 RepID=UPI0037B861F1
MSADPSSGNTARANTVPELTERLRVFVAERDWEQFHTAKNLAMALAGEVGELLAELQWLTPEQAARVMDNPAAGARVRAEIGDVMTYLTRLADVLDIDLVEAAHDKLDDSALRYTVERARGSVAKVPPHQPSGL